jgi:hypothetical protein
MITVDHGFTLLSVSPRTARARLTHSRTAVSVKSMSRATAATVLHFVEHQRTTAAFANIDNS